MSERAPRARETCMRDCSYDRPYVPLPPLNRAAIFADKGEPRSLAGVIVKELPDLSDAQKKELMAKATQVRLERLQDSPFDYSDVYMNAQKERARRFRNTRKEGKALISQIIASYPGCSKKIT